VAITPKGRQSISFLVLRSVTVLTLSFLGDKLILDPLDKLTPYVFALMSEEVSLSRNVIPYLLLTSLTGRVILI
jgi:hypothetical protein